MVQQPIQLRGRGQNLAETRVQDWDEMINTCTATRETYELVHSQVFPESLQATRAQASWFSTNHLFNDFITRFLSANDE